MDAGIIETTAGIELDKHYERDEYELPSVVYEFVSNRSDTVEVTLEESIPAELDPEFLGFHANYGSEHWQVEDETMVFEYELDPDEEYKTVIGVNPNAEFDVETLVTTPETFEIEVLEDPTSGHSSPESFTRSASSDDDSSGGEPTPSPRIDSEEAPNAAESNQGTAGSQPSAHGASPTTESEDEGYDEIGDRGSIGEKLAAELEAGTPSEEATETLRQQLQPDQSVTGSVDARLDQLQSDISTMRAYTNALEEFLDENGSAEDLIREFREEIESFEDELRSVKTRIDAHDDDIDSLRADMDERVDEHDSLSVSIASAQDDIDDLSSDVSHLKGELPEDDVDERLATMEEEMAEISEIINRLNEAFK